MNTSNALAPAPDSTPRKRGRKPNSGSHQLLIEARKNLALAQQRHEKALAQVEQERRANLARTGRQVFLAAIERMHVGERGLLTDPVLSGLPENDRSAVQTWLDSLTRA